MVQVFVLNISIAMLLCPIRARHYATLFQATLECSPLQMRLCLPPTPPAIISDELPIEFELENCHKVKIGVCREFINRTMRIVDGDDGIEEIFFSKLSAIKRRISVKKSKSWQIC